MTNNYNDDAKEKNIKDKMSKFERKKPSKSYQYPWDLYMKEIARDKGISYSEIEEELSKNQYQQSIISEDSQESEKLPEIVKKPMRMSLYTQNNTFKGLKASLSTEAL